MRIAFAVTFVTVGLAASAALAVTKADLAGKNLVMGKTEIRLNADGKMTGKVGKDGDEVLTGVWSIDKGNFCRTITAPKRLAGQACQKAAIKGKVFTLTRDDGTTLNYDIK